MFIFFFIVLDEHIYSFVRMHVRSYNIFIYVLGLISFFLAYGVFYKKEKLFLKLKYCVKWLWRKLVEHALAIVIILFVVIAFDLFLENVRYYRNSYWVFHYNKYKIFLMMAVLTVVSAVVDINEFRYKKCVLRVISVLAVLFSLYTTVLCLTYYASDLTFNTLTNNEATFSEIYNLYHGEPFSMTQFGIYGRYAFFYVPLLGIMGGMSIQNCIILHTIVACLIVLGYVYFIVKTVRNPVIKCLSFLCFSFFWGSITVVTYQSVVRFVPGALMFFFLGVIYRKKLNLKRVLLGYLVGAIGIVWNLEYGLVASLSWAVYVNWLQYVQGERRDNTIMIVYACKGLGSVVVTFVVSWLLAGAINVGFYHGEVLSLKNFMIPHVNSAYMINSLQSFLLVRGQLPWLCVIGVSLFSIGIFGNVSSETSDFEKNGVVLFVATAVLGGLVYYINRFHFGLIFIIYFQGLSFLALLFDRILEVCAVKIKAQDTSAKELFWGVRGSTFFVAVALMVCAVINVGYVNTHRQELYGKTIEEAQEGERLLYSIKNIVPENTPAAGRGMTEIYNRLGWDTGYHLTDAIGQTKESTDKYEKLLLDGESKVVCMESVDPYVKAGWITSDLYEKVDEMYDKVYIGNINKADYWYWVKK